MRSLVLSALLLAATSVRADDPPKVISAPVTYELRDLRPTGFTQYTGVGEVVRQYFEFQNTEGTHHVVYEEVPSALPARTVAPLRQLANAFDSSCAMDIECSSKAFCTGECRHMYYEVANAPGDNLSPDRAKCKILYLTCEKGGAKAASATSVTGAPATPAPAGN